MSNHSPDVSLLMFTANPTAANTRVQTIQLLGFWKDMLINLTSYLDGYFHLQHKLYLFVCLFLLHISCWTYLESCICVELNVAHPPQVYVLDCLFPRVGTVREGRRPLRGRASVGGVGHQAWLGGCAAQLRLLFPSASLVWMRCDQPAPVTVSFLPAAMSCLCDRLWPSRTMSQDELLSP